MRLPTDVKSFAAAANVSRETAERFAAWGEVLSKWNARINLVGASTAESFWTRHALDSVQIAPLISADAQCVADVGSGAGFPGLAVALALADRGQNAAVHLIESNGKKAAFLREAVRATGASNVEVHGVRAEELNGLGADSVTARAFARLTDLCAQVHALGHNKAVGLFLKGRDTESELAEARERWSFHVTVTPSRSDPSGRIVRLEEVALCPQTRSPNPTGET